MRARASSTYTGFIAKATVDALRAFPIVNASLDADKIVYKADVNLGIAVALDWGLIVPVIRNAGERTCSGSAARFRTQRARAKKLQPEEVQGGTFTITNPAFRRRIRPSESTSRSRPSASEQSRSARSSWRMPSASGRCVTCHSVTTIA